LRKGVQMPGAQAKQDTRSVAESAGEEGSKLMANSTAGDFCDVPASSLLDQEKRPLQGAASAPQVKQEGANEHASTLGQPSVPVALTQPATAAQGDVPASHPCLFER
jgi:hypothetical protein